MKQADETRTPNRVDSPHRRQLMQMTIAGAGLILSARSFTAGAAPSLAIDARLHKAQVDGSLIDARALQSQVGLHKLTMLAGYSQIPVAFEALYAADARHRFWQAWRENDQMYQSSPSTLRWVADGAGGLTIAAIADGASTMVSVPGLAGTYVLAIGMAGQAAPAVQNFVVREATADRPITRLVGQRSGVGATFPHLIFAVAPLSA